MTPKRLLSTILICLVVVPAFISCSGSGGGGGGIISSEDMPWAGPFVEAAPESSEVTDLVVSVETEMSGLVPESVRQTIIDHISGTLAAAAPRTAKGDPPDYQVEPENECEAFIMAGNSAILQGYLSLGTWAFSRAVLSDPDDPFALNQFAWSLIANGRFREAKGLLLQLLETNPEFWTAWSSLGYIYERTGEFYRATYCYQMGLMVHSGSLFINLKLAALLLRQGDINGAALHTGIAFSIKPQNEEVLSLKEQIETAGGVVYPVEPAGIGRLSSGAASDVVDEIAACSEEQAIWMSRQMVPVSQAAYRDGRAHEDNRITIDDNRRDCISSCAPSDTTCDAICDMNFCVTMGSEITQQYNRNLNYLYTEMGLASAYRARFRNCSYSIIEDRIAELSPDETASLYEYVDWQVKMHENSYIGATEDEEAFYISELAGIASDCASVDIEAALAEITPESEQDPLFDEGMEACADGFFCLTFGESSVGFSVGVGFASGGLAADYVTDDLIFSIGVSADTGVSAVGLDAKLSIQEGIGLSPNVKFGGPIRSTVSRDFWLYSF